MPKNCVRTHEKQLCYNCRQLFTKVRIHLYNWFFWKTGFFLKLFIWTSVKHFRQPRWKSPSKNWSSFNQFCEKNLKNFRKFLKMFSLECSPQPCRKYFAKSWNTYRELWFFQKKCFSSNWSSRHIDCRFDNPTKNLLPNIRKKSKTYQKRKNMSKNCVRTHEKQLCYNCRQLFTKVR